MSHDQVAARSTVVTLGGAFMTSHHLRAREAALGLPERTLYFRGRSAVLGDPSPAVVAAAFGIFPPRLVEAVITGVTPLVPASAAVAAYSQACADWGADVLGDAPDAEDAARLLLAVVDAADPSALVLFAGWRGQPRPASPAERLAHALMLTRELRGGLHFAALRATGLSVLEAAAVEPAGGRDRLLRTGWPSDAAEALVQAAARRPDLPERWRRAEQLTEDAFDRCLDALSPDDAGRLRELLVAYANLVPHPRTGAA